MKNRKLRVICAFLAVLMLLSAVSINAAAFDGPSRKWATIDRAKLVKVSGTGCAVQKAYVASDNEVYVYQRASNGKDMVLTRCTRTGGKGSFIAKDRMVLTGFGHAQSLDKDSSGYFWSTCHGTGGEFNFGNYVTRFKYQAGKTVSYTSLKRWTTSSGRVELATSTNGKYLYIRLKDGSCGRYAVSTMLSKIGSKSSIALSSVSKASAHYVGCPEGSNQGLEFSDGYAVYIAGSKHYADGKWTNPKIWKKTGSGYVKKEMTGMPQAYEVEGIQIKGSYLYVSVTAHNSPNQFYIYRVGKSLWG